MCLNIYFNGNIQLDFKIKKTKVLQLTHINQNQIKSINKTTNRLQSELSFVFEKMDDSFGAFEGNTPQCL